MEKIDFDVIKITCCTEDRLNVIMRDRENAGWNMLDEVNIDGGFFWVRMAKRKIAKEDLSVLGLRK